VRGYIDRIIDLSMISDQLRSHPRNACAVRQLPMLKIRGTLEYQFTVWNRVVTAQHIDPLSTLVKKIVDGLEVFLCLREMYVLHSALQRTIVFVTVYLQSLDKAFSHLDRF
jgi:hypothetical protein